MMAPSKPPPPRAADDETEAASRETDDVAGPARPSSVLTDEPSGAARPEGREGPPAAHADGHGHGEDDEEDAFDESAADDGIPEEQEPPPPQVAELAAACLRFVTTRFGAMLDFQPDTLSFVDQWIRDARADLVERPEVADVVQAAAGAYLGEVIRLAFGGHWVVVDGEYPAWRLQLEKIYCSFNPIGMAREALLLEPADGWQAHFELDPGERDEIEQRLAALPAVSDDEFYAPSTRFDVVSILFDALRAAMRAGGHGAVRFTAEDYR